VNYKLLLVLFKVGATMDWASKSDVRN